MSTDRGYLFYCVPDRCLASSGDNVRHRLSRAGNRQINRVLPIMATVQLGNATEGKTSMEAMRAVKRRLSDIVHRHLIDDAITHAVTGLEGNGATGQRL